MDIKSIIEDNHKRNLEFSKDYDPVLGIGSPIKRRKLSYFYLSKPIEYFAPETMFNELVIAGLNGQHVEKFIRKFDIDVTKENCEKFLLDILNIRLNHDFEFWAYYTIKINSKLLKRSIPFKLNRPQRKLLLVFESQRLAGKPIRVDVLKARQWGGSTLTQIYMAWIQNRLTTNWHSVIVAKVKSQARVIRGMYSKAAREYPKELGDISLKPFEHSSETRHNEQRGHMVTIGSVEEPENLRTFDFAMAHLSECGLWRSTEKITAEDLAQSIIASVPDSSLSMLVLESTAKGVGNFWHKHWTAAKEGKNNHVPVFIAWFEIEMYRLKIIDYGKFIQTLNEYEWKLWRLGATLEGINWYRRKKADMGDDEWRMMEEFPSDDLEAFISTGQRVFAPSYVENARKNCIKPVFIGDIFADATKGPDSLKNIEFRDSPGGNFYVWIKPDTSLEVSNRYVVIVDIGGRTAKADWSVIRVLDRIALMDMDIPEFVATWKGHIDQDILAWKATQISTWYDNALLVIEANSLEHDEENHVLTVLDEIAKFYTNLYYRTDPEKIKAGVPIKYGFFTDRRTKPMVIDRLNGALRDSAFVERDSRACDEMDTYEKKTSGIYGAKDGCHDDIVMPTAIGIYVSESQMDPPKEIIRGKQYTKKVIGVSSL